MTSRSTARTSRVGALRTRLGETTIRDAHRLRRRLDKAASRKDPGERESALATLESAIEAAERRLRGRRDAVPRIAYPDELPVSARRDDIAEAIRDHQVVVIAGETGSGKTTQIPKILLELGRGVHGAIGHTQPRRIAARTVAERIADETGTQVGDAIGYAVRFADRTGPNTLVKVMTDGLLLAEIHDDPLLRQYDTIVVDEAHERSLSIDFLLGYLKRILPRRRDLKVVITSATIDPERFAALFDDAPILTVSGRTYPVEVRYRPVAEREDGDTYAAISDAVDELSREAPGDILVFLSGEREIRDATDLLSKRRLPRTEVVPLYGRLSAADQHKVFASHTGRRIVLATNVAETSLTVPGIRYVIDTGTARISRYSQRLKVQRLPIEPISQASARQRSGRCGRTSDGICIRLYAEEDFEARPEYTDPEILRTNLASVVLRMAALDLGAVEDFGFMDPPDRRTVRAGVDLLHELRALETDERTGRPRLTRTGRRLADLPVDPRLGRMLLAAADNDALREVLVIVSALSIQDPRERPLEHQQAADARHARYADRDSDFAALLNLWTYVRERRRELSGSAFRRMCRDEYLHFLRLREWADVHGLLRQSVKDLGLTVNERPAGSDRVHESLLAGLLSHVGLRDGDGREYLGARQARFAIFPGSALAKKPPRWVMAAELVETSRLWARTAARIDPQWIERLASHLVSRSYSEPHWSTKREAVMAYERVTLYGIPIVVDRTVDYGSIDPALARELFLRHALVQGEWRTRHRFFTHNAELIAEVESWEDRVRRRDIRVDDDALFAFYDARVGADVTSARHFDSWWKRVRRDSPALLDLTLEDLTRDDADAVDAGQFPTEWHSGEFELPIAYAFEPGSVWDGTTIDIPLTALGDVDEAALAWGVPGQRLDLVAGLLKTLPKSWRRTFGPAQQFAERIVRKGLDDSRPVLDAVTATIRDVTGEAVPHEAFELSRLPDHLRPTYRVVSDGDTMAVGKDLAALREQLRPRVRERLTNEHELARTGLTGWDFDALPRTVEGAGGATGYPALADRGDHVAVVVTESPARQDLEHRLGIRRLLALTLPSQVSHLSKSLPSKAKLSLTAAGYPSVRDVLEDCRRVAIDGVCGDTLTWTRAEFEALAAHVREEAYPLMERAALDVAAVVDAQARLRDVLDAASPAQAEIVRDVEVQVSWLVYPGFVAEAGHAHLRDVPRYLEAARVRLQAPNPHAEDADRHQVQDLEAAYFELTESMDEHLRQSPAVTNVRWALEELRVSLFAQRLRAHGTVSVKRVARMLDELRTS